MQDGYTALNLAETEDIRKLLEAHMNEVSCLKLRRTIKNNSHCHYYYYGAAK